MIIVAFPRINEGAPIIFGSSKNIFGASPNIIGSPSSVSEASKMIIPVFPNYQRNLFEYLRRGFDCLLRLSAYQRKRSDNSRNVFKDQRALCDG